MAANRLNRMGYAVTVFERCENAGGLLRYGIPNFKLNKAIIDRRLHLLYEEGIDFRYGEDIDLTSLPEGYDAYVVSTGTPTARDLPVPGRELRGVHFALDMLSQQNRILAGTDFKKDELVNARDKDVLVIGGGDTGSDCDRHGPPSRLPQRDTDRDHAQTARRSRRPSQPVAQLSPYVQDHIEP